MGIDSSEELYFDDLTEDQGPYFIRYHPPSPGCWFANLTLNFTHEVELCEVIKATKSESTRWFKRYPVPIMASAWDEYGNSIPINEEDGRDHFWLTWMEPASNSLSHSWHTDDLPNFFNTHSPQFDLRNIYADIPYRTDSEVQEAVTKDAKIKSYGNRIWTVATVFWFVIIPAGYAVFEFFGPEYIGVLALIYALGKLMHELLKLTGKLPMSPNEKKKSEKERKMQHYYFHCEQNPDGFLKLKSENLSREIRQNRKDEHARIRDAESVVK